MFSIKKTDFWAEPLAVYSALRVRGAASVLLESLKPAAQAPATSRYSIAAFSPFMTFESGASDPFLAMKRLLRKFSFRAPTDFPPFVGGAIGYFAYEAKRHVEPKLSWRVFSGPHLPEAYFLFFKEGFVFDHQKRSVFIFAASVARMTALEKQLCQVSQNKNAAKPPRMAAETSRIERSFRREEFVEKVLAAKRYIQRGDIFQANLSQRLEFGLRSEPLAVYAALRRVNPSSFFGFLDAGDFQIISGSPERLVKMQNGVLETRPIAGTRSRPRGASRDAAMSLELLLNEKERAEHVMLVDLERNDMGRVAEYGSVSVDELMAIEDYSHVKHIVSNVRGTLRKGLDGVDVLKAFFPGGTITGAPKVRCMEIIDELEPVARGPYTGSLGYLSFSGNLDFNILIRSLVIQNKKAALHVGAGIVADSDPEKEYDETLYKAEAVLSAVFGAEKTRRFLRGSGVAAIRVS